MTAMATDGLTHRIADSASIASPDKLESLAYRVWQEVVRCGTENTKHNGVNGVKFKGALPIARVGGELRNGLAQDQRETLDNAVRQFLRYSGNAICTNKQKGQIEWWAARVWTPASAVTSVRTSTRPQAQENWFEKKVTEQEITGGYEPFPVETRKVDGTKQNPRIEPAEKLKPTPAAVPARPTPAKIAAGPFELDPRWEDELLSLIVYSSDDSPTMRTVNMLATWTEPFTTTDFATLYNATVMTPATTLATMHDAGLANRTQGESRSYGGRASPTWSTTPEQREALAALLDKRDAGVRPPKLVDGRLRVIGALGDGNTMSTSEVAKQGFLTRSRVNNMLRTLSDEGSVIRETLGRGYSDSTWRLSPKVSQKDIENGRAAIPTLVSRTPAPTPVPAPASPRVVRPDPFVPDNHAQKEPSPSETDDIARSIDRIVQKRVVAALDDVTKAKDVELKKANDDLVELRDKLSKANDELVELREWKRKAQEFLNS